MGWSDGGNWNKWIGCPGGCPGRIGLKRMMEKTMRIQVDPDKCQGHNRCMVLAPGMFELDEFAYATATEDGVVAEGQEEKARLAVANCPEFAIEITEE